FDVKALRLLDEVGFQRLETLLDHLGPVAVFLDQQVAVLGIAAGRWLEIDAGEDLLVVFGKLSRTFRGAKSLRLLDVDVDVDKGVLVAGIVAPEIVQGFFALLVALELEQVPLLPVAFAVEIVDADVDWQDRARPLNLLSAVNQT